MGGQKANSKHPTKHPIRLTTTFVEKLTGAVLWWDDDPKATGFGVRSYPGGGKSFFIDYRLNGRQGRYTIGPFPRWSVAAARDRAKELRRLIDQGHDPAGEKRARREAPTVQDLIDRYVEEHMPRKRLVGHRRNDELRMLDEIGQHFGRTTKVADVHGGDAAAMHRRITENGRPVRANRIRALGSKMFSLSLVPMAGETLAWRAASLGNPFRGVARNYEEGRERFFSSAELAAISDALNAYSGASADCIRLIMLTGARPNEAIRAEWSEFDNEPGFWIKPSSHTKQKKLHKLPLSPAAIELIDRLRKTRKGKWVFPGYIVDEPLATLTHVWRFVRERTGLGLDAKVYSLRHSFASIGAGGGLGLPIIGRLLGHVLPSTTAKYAHLADDPLREAAEKITTVITGAGKAGAKVIGIKR